MFEPSFRTDKYGWGSINQYISFVGVKLGSSPINPTASITLVLRVSISKSHSFIWNAFEKSTLKIWPKKLRFWRLLTSSLAAIMLSVIILPSMNVDWEGSTTELITSLGWLARTLEIILSSWGIYLTYGSKVHRFRCTRFFFGINTMLG